jgi:hypothetical protein
MTYSPRHLEVFNNIFHAPGPPDTSGSYVWMSKSLADTSADIAFYNNTVHNVDKVLLLDNESGVLRIYNNIFSGVSDDFATVYKTEATLDLRNNLYSSDPGWSPYSGSTEVGRIVARPDFYNGAGGDFRILPNGSAVDAGTTTLASDRDVGLLERDGAPDIGAWEARP